jgi:ABC-type nitrate/sulfonate/bicarbonate transport system substrate-binding protein
MTIRTKLSGAAAIVVAVAGAVFFACSRPESPTERVTLRLAYRPLALADTTPVVLKESGLTSEAVNVELVPVPSPQVALQRFDAGEVDAIAGLTMEAVLQRIAEHRDPGFRAFFFQVDMKGEGWVSLVANRRLGTVSLTDLAGKNVASLPTDQARYLVRKILQAAGVPDAQIRIVDYNPTTALLGLESGEHDALFGLEPAISRAVAQGHHVIARGPVSEYLFAGKPVPLSASVVRTTFLQEHPDAYRAFLELFRKAVDFQKSRPAEVRAYFSKPDYGGLEPSVYEKLALPNLSETNSPGVLDALTEFVANLRQAGILKPDVDVRVLVQ